MSLARRTFTALVALAAVVTVLVVATGALSQDPGPNPVTQRPAAGDVVSSVDPALRDHLAVFGRPAQAGDTPSDPVAGSAIRQGGNTALARLAAVTSTGAKVYLVPDSGGLCMVSSDYLISNCAPTVDVLAARLGGTVRCSPFLDTEKLAVFGIAPDDAKGGIVRFADGTTKPLAIQGGVFALVSPQSAPIPTTIEWDANDGHHSMDVSRGLNVPRPPGAPAKCVHAVTPAQARRVMENPPPNRPLGAPGPIIDRPTGTGPAG